MKRHTVQFMILLLCITILSGECSNAQSGGREVVDFNAGNIVYNADNEITCEVNGPARLLGMEDSNPSNIEDYKDNKQHAFHGKLLMYLQSLDKTGPVTIILSSPGLQGTNVELNVTK